MVAAPEGGADVQTLLPTTLRVTNLDAGGLLIQEKLIGPPASQNCRGPTGCSINLDPISVTPGTRVLLEAIANGKVIASQEFTKLGP